MLHLSSDLICYPGWKLPFIKFTDQDLIYTIYFLFFFLQYIPDKVDDSNKSNSMNKNGDETSDVLVDVPSDTRDEGDSVKKYINNTPRIFYHTLFFPEHNTARFHEKRLTFRVVDFTVDAPWLMAPTTSLSSLTVSCKIAICQTEFFAHISLFGAGRKI